jgi:hypothetical protein
MIDQWMILIPAILTQLLLLFTPGLLLLLQFGFSWWILVGFSPFVTILFYRCIGELFSAIGINYNVVTVTLFSFAVIGSVFLFYGVKRIPPIFRFTPTSLPVLKVVMILIFMGLAGFQYIELVESPLDVFVWSDMVAHQDLVLEINENQSLSPIFLFPRISYPAGAHLLVALNIQLTHIPITTGLIVLEFIGSLIFSLGMCGLGSYLFKSEFSNARAGGVLAGGMVGLIAYTGIRYYSTLQPLFPFQIGLCLLPLAMSTIFRLTESARFANRQLILWFCLIVIGVCIFFVHPSLAPVIVLFASLNYCRIRFSERPWVCFLIVVLASVFWFYSSHSLYVAQADWVHYFDSPPYTVVYHSDFYKWLFFVLCLIGSLVLIFKAVPLFIFCCVIFVSFLLSLDAGLNNGYANNPVLAFLYRVFTALFYGLSARVQAVYMIGISFLILVGVAYVASVAKKATRIFFSKTKVRYMSVVGTLLTLVIGGIYYIGTLKTGSEASHRNELFWRQDSQFYQAASREIQRERQFAFYAKQILPEDALVQVEVNEGGHLFHFFQNIPTTPGRAHELDFNPDLQSLDATCSFIESSSNEIYFLEFGKNPHKQWAGYAPNFDFSQKYKIIPILRDANNVLYQIDCSDDR